MWAFLRFHRQFCYNPIKETIGQANRHNQLYNNKLHR